MKYLNSVAYVLLIVLVNWLFTVVPLVELPGGTMWPPVSLLVGFIFVARDFAQREVGHWVLALMAIGVMLSYFMASPQVALASATAFLISELLDWAVYTYTKRPLSERILYSSVLGTPVDSSVFLCILRHFPIVGLSNNKAPQKFASDQA